MFDIVGFFFTAGRELKRHKKNTVGRWFNVKLVWAGSLILNYLEVVSIVLNHSGEIV